MVSGGGLSIPVPTKQRPSEVPFFFVDRPLARDELVVLPLRVAGVSRRCLVIDAYCTAPKCTCRNALLWFVEIPAQPGNEAARLSPGVLLEAMENAWYRGTPLVELVFDLKTEVFGTKEQQLRQVLTEAISELHQRFTSAHVKLLLEHRERVRAWAKENPWHQRERDWTNFELGACVSWTTLYPSASLLTAFHEGFHHVFADMYCTNPACQCEEALLSVGRREGSASSAREVGLLRVSLQAADEGELEVEKGDPVSLRGAYAELLASRPGALSLFRRRKSAMRDFGRFMETKGSFFDVSARATQGTFGVEPYSLRESKILRESMIDVPRRPGIEDPRRRVIVSRNAPCPCGSGRKFKKCCGRAARC